MARVRHVIRNGKIVHVRATGSSGRSRTRKRSSSSSRRSQPRYTSGPKRGQFKPRGR